MEISSEKKLHGKNQKVKDFQPAHNNELSIISKNFKSTVTKQEVDC